MSGGERKRVTLGEMIMGSNSVACELNPLFQDVHKSPPCLRTCIGAVVYCLAPFKGVESIHLAPDECVRSSLTTGRHWLWRVPVLSRLR